ncbi:MAG: thioesterase family protein [Aquabacterium sp.]|nr:thioesterase family protein [Aquabacterium sp.]
MTHPLDTALHLQPAGDDRFDGATSAAYANMIGPFGGTTAAVALQAVLQHPARQGEPVALTVNYAAALADGPFTVQARPVRTNRSTQHWLVQIEQPGGVVLTATAVLAVRRATWSACDLQPPAGVPAADAIPPAPTAGRMAWVQRYDMRFVEGGVPLALDGAEQPHARSRLWLRDEPPRPLDFPALTALCDAFFPRIYLRRRALVPIGTVSLTAYFHADAALLAQQGSGHVLADVRGLSYRNGYFDQSAELWSASGELLVTTTQVVYYRE